MKRCHVRRLTARIIARIIGASCRDAVASYSAADTKHVVVGAIEVSWYFLSIMAGITACMCRGARIETAPVPSGRAVKWRSASARRLANMAVAREASLNCRARNKFSIIEPKWLDTYPGRARESAASNLSTLTYL